MENQKININLTPEMAEGTYANLAIIAHSNSEFVIDFVRMMPGQKEANVQSRVIMTPDNAKKLLWNSDIAMSDIAEKSGFGCQQYMNKVFKKETGMTPNEYRKTFQQNYSL